MNPYGSYKALLENSMSAMLAAIEIYNKPSFTYRSECFVILLLNSWELFFKATLSKNRVRIFQPKKRNEPYMTLTIWDAMKKSKEFFPTQIQHSAVFENISRLADYRNNSVHFYNEEGLDVVVYGLSQTSIVNYRDLVNEIFSKDIAQEVNISLLPLSFNSPPDPIAFIGEAKEPNTKPEVAEYMRLISQTTRELERDGIDTGRFLTVFEVNLQSTKKIQSADLIAGITANESADQLLVTKRVDPNLSHPFFRKHVLEKIGGSLNGSKFTSYTFDAIVWHRKYKHISNYCWQNERTKTCQYSTQMVAKLKSLTKQEIEESLRAYRERNRNKS